MDSRVSSAHVVLLLAFAARLGGVGITVTTGLNPDAESDAVGFANAARDIAATNDSLLEIFQYLYAILAAGNFRGTYEIWGSFIAPFWLLPGPSLVYASIANAFLGAFAVYNVYLIGRHYHSNWAGFLAAAPILIFPSFVAIHSTVLREAIMLFAFTTVVRLLVVPNGHHLLIRLAVAIPLAPLIVLFRVENTPFVLAAAGIGIFLYPIVYSTYWPRAFGVGALAAVAAAVYAYSEGILASLQASIQNYYQAEVHPQLVDSVYRGEEGFVEYVAFLRAARLREDGRTEYLVDIVPETIPEIIDLAPMLTLYFLFVPFPWMVETAIDLIVAVESAIMMVYALFGIVGFLYLAKRNLPLAVALLVGLLSFSLVNGLVAANVGTAMRQRQVFYWIIPLFGGIGIARLLEGNLYLRTVQRTWVNQVGETPRSEIPAAQTGD